MCDCLQEVNTKLAEHNSKVEIAWIGPQVPFVSTIKLDEKKRGKPVRMFASCCPFCGEKYPSERTAALAVTSHNSGGTDGAA